MDWVEVGDYKLKLSFMPIALAFFALEPGVTAGGGCKPR
jgi:hypothetical protein